MNYQYIFSTSIKNDAESPRKIHCEFECSLIGWLSCDIFCRDSLGRNMVINENCHSRVLPAGIHSQEGQLSIINYQWSMINIFF